MIAFAVRLLPWPTVVGDERIVFFGMDAWYHMRRVLYALANSGTSLTSDPYLNYPLGAQPIWSPLFDGLVAFVLSPVYAATTLRMVELGAALLPPALGSACVVATWFVARTLFGGRVAATAGLMLCFLSGHYWYSQLGFLDHHVASALFGTLLLGGAISLLNALAAHGANPRERWDGHAGVGALAAFALLLWPGALLHVGLVVGGLLGFTVSRSSRREAIDVALGTVLLYSVAFFLVLPETLGSTSAQWGKYSPVVLSRFQPWMFGALALHAACCALLWKVTPLGRSRVARVLQNAAIGVSLLGVSLALIPELSAGAADAWGWFTKDEVFQAIVSESKPLFLGPAGWHAGNGVLRLSHLVWFFPFAAVALAWHAVRSPQRAGLLLLLFYAIALALATLLQRRFFNSLSPVFVIIVAWGGFALLRALPSTLRSTRARRVASSVVLLVAGVGLFAPTLDAYRVPLRNLSRHFEGRPLAFPQDELTRRRALAAAEWLRLSTPRTAGYLDARATPEYGVLAPWGYGHLLKYVAQRPTVVGNFGDDVGERNLRRVEAYFRSGESDAIRVLADLGVRYVMVETLARTGPKQRARSTMRSRLSVDDSPGLAHHRLLWESPLEPGPGATALSELRIFEVVAGAVVEGEADPGVLVRATLRYESNRGRQGLFETVAEASSTGAYRLRVPYATQGAAPGVAADRAYALRAGDRVASLVVDEHAVLGGLTLPGPDLSTNSPTE